MSTARKILELCEDAEQMFEMASFFSATTGLPFKVWLSDNSYAKSHNEPRLKAEVSPGDLTSVRLDPPYLETGTPLKARDKKALIAWIELNRDAIMAYWNQEIDTATLTQQIRKVSP